MILDPPCDICGVKESHSYKNRNGLIYCGDCVKINTPRYVGIAHAQEVRRQADNHKKDLIQPFRGDNINPDFVKHYPEQSKEMFRPKDLNKVKYGLPAKYNKPIINSDGKNTEAD